MRPGVLLLSIFLGLPACSSDQPIAAPTSTAGNPTAPVATPWPGTLSGAVTPGGSVLGVSGTGGHAAYVGLPPGTIPSAVLYTVSSRRSLAAQYVMADSVRSGGFDPVPIAAETGDTLTIVITRSDRSISTYKPVVPVPGAPVVVRLSPPTGTSDVPLNASFYAVFSEPILPSLQPAGAMRLLRAGTEVAGELRTRDSQSLIMAVEPSVVLESGATYQLDVTRNVVAAGGRSLASPAQGSFTTMVTSLPSTLAVQSFTMIEYEYPSAPGSWFYAPQILVAETSGHGSITILRIDVTEITSFHMTRAASARTPATWPSCSPTATKRGERVSCRHRGRSFRARFRLRIPAVIARWRRWTVRGRRRATGGGRRSYI